MALELILSNKVPVRVWIQFDDENAGIYQRLLFRDYMIVKSLPPNWTPLEMTARRFQRGQGASSVQVVRKQFPISPPEANTQEPRKHLLRCCSPY